MTFLSETIEMKAIKQSFPCPKKGPTEQSFLLVHFFEPCFNLQTRFCQRWLQVNFPHYYIIYDDLGKMLMYILDLS